MLSQNEQIAMYFDQLMRRIDEDGVLSKWDYHIAFTNIRRELVDMYKLKLFSVDWRETSLKTDKWKTKVMRTMNKLSGIEMRLDFKSDDDSS